MKKIIAIEAQRLFRSKKHGMEIVALEILKHLKNAAGNDFIYQVVVKEDVDECITSSSNFTVAQLPAKAYPIWEQILLPSFIKKLNAALLHCCSNTAPLFCKTPMVVTIHDVIYMQAGGFKGSAYQNFGNLYRRWIVPKAAKKAKAIISVSEFAKKEIVAALNVQANKVHVVYNGLNAIYRPCTDIQKSVAFRTEYKLPEKYLLHFGNTATRKNTSGVLKAYIQHCSEKENSLPLVISGCSKGTITAIAQRENLRLPENNIFYTGYLEAAALPLLYSNAFLFLYPSFAEGFGLPLVESMACGTPVITAHNSSLPEVAGDAALFVDAANPNEIFLAINRLLTDANLYNQLKEKGLKNAARFSWEKAANQTKEIYKMVLNNL